MIQRRDGAGFLFETFQAFGFVGDRRREDFDGDVAAEARVARFVDFAHAARADQRHDFIRAEFSTGGEWQGPRIIPLRAGPDTPGKSTTPRSARPSAILILATHLAMHAHIRCERLWNRQTCLWLSELERKSKPQASLPIPLAYSP